MISLINPKNYRLEGLLERKGICADQCPWNPLPIYREPVHKCALHLQEITGNMQCQACKDYTKDHKKVKDK